MKENCKINYYHIDDSFLPKVSFNKDDYILYPNYFGICDKNVELLAKMYPNLIVDNAHSFYSKPLGLACFDSARKFLPVFYGSRLYIKKTGCDLEKEDVKEFKKYSEEEKIKIENDFEKYDIKFVDDYTAEKIALLNNQNERKENFLLLHEKYKDTNLLKIDCEVESPFCYPYLAKTSEVADDLVMQLSKSNKIIYRYWNKIPTFYNEYKFYRRLIPIPLD